MHGLRGDLYSLGSPNEPACIHIHLSYRWSWSGACNRSVVRVDPLTTNSNVGVGHWWHFEEGYGTFFNTLGNTLVADNKLDLHLNSKVTNITRHKEQWCVTVDGKTPEYFDIIFMSTSPKDALNFMPLGRAKDILSVATIPDTWPSKDIMIAKLAPGYNQTGFTTTFGAWVMPFGSTADQWPMYPSFLQKRDVHDYVLLEQVVPSRRSPVYSQINAHHFIIFELPFNISDVVETVRVNFPSFPRHPDDWYTWTHGWQSEQGLNDMYYIGEAFGGAGVPGIIDFFAHMRAAKLTVKSDTKGWNCPWVDSTCE